MPNAAQRQTSRQTKRPDGGTAVLGRIPILEVGPAVAAGHSSASPAFPAKAVVGEEFTVTATIFREGHDALGANVVLSGPARPVGPARTGGPPGARASRRASPPAWIPMTPGAPGTDRWHATVVADAPGEWTFRIEAWADPVASWRHAAQIKVPADVDSELVLAEGALLLERAARDLPRGCTAQRKLLRDAVRALKDSGRPAPARLAAATADDVTAVLAAHPLRELVTTSEPYPLWVDRERALVGAWYEFFPRSEGAHAGPAGHQVSGTFATAARRLPAIAQMGFDVVYLPPVHPIGEVNRKGPNNALAAAPDDPGSPWAIGSARGGHDAVHPDLGTLADFDAFVARARELGLEVALDLALQVAPDHPWAREHPEWFTLRADGSIAYAENPPKKYQDIYPLNFDRDPEGLFAEIVRVTRHWMAHGVRIFRVDNPHTKPVAFWERYLRLFRATDPDVVFLAEAFTRPPMMQVLAKVGFHQSYTYFTWRDDKAGLTDYLAELSHRTSHFLRPNLFVNTPDILSEFLQYGGQAAFKIRAVLAATAAPSWGVYSGYELTEHLALRPGSEEYLDSEKYQYRPRDWAAYEPGGPHEGESLGPYLRRLNEIRRAHPALRRLRNLAFHDVAEDHLLVFSKRVAAPDADTVIVVVNLDPHAAHESVVSLDMPGLGMDWNQSFLVTDELSGASWHWGRHNYVRLDPAVEPAHILTVRQEAA